MTIATIRCPIATLEQARFRGRLRRQALAHPPVFIVGHWRSGTTHLQNLLAQDPQFGYVTLLQAAMPREFLSMGRIAAIPLRKAIPETRFMDNIKLSIDAPWEEEMALIGLGLASFYNVSFFPESMRRIYDEAVLFDGLNERQVEQWCNGYRNFLHKVQFANPSRRLLLKNPANSARIALMCRLFPGSKFIHIHRDPYRVFSSTVHLYEKAQANWQLQRSGHGDTKQHVLDTYPLLMARLEGDAGKLPSNQYVAVRFGDLENEPMRAVGAIYEKLGLSGFEGASAYFERYLASVQGYAKNKLGLSLSDKKRVASAWSDWFDKLGYPT